LRRFTLDRSRAGEAKRTSIHHNSDSSSNSSSSVVGADVGGIAIIMHVQSNSLQYTSVTKRGVLMMPLIRDAIATCVSQALLQLKQQNNDILLSKQEAQVC
jgi:DNA topoisomerase VI subunit B